MDGRHLLDQVRRALWSLRSIGHGVDVLLTSRSIENARAAAVDSTIRREAFAAVMNVPHEQGDIEAIA